MASVSAPNRRRPIGYLALRDIFRLGVPSPHVESYVGPGARRTKIEGHRITELYPNRYAPANDTPVAHLTFALRHEPVNLSILVEALKAMAPADLEGWIRREPTGAHSRRAWFFYETFTGRTLDVPDASAGNYVEALNPKKHLVTDRRDSPRHRVIDNLLGDHGMCATVRRTERLDARLSQRLEDEARALTAHYDEATLARAVSFLYTKETRSSFAIEGETPSANRTERFVAALKRAPAFDPSNKAGLLRLQGLIVDPRYAAKDWRTFQNFVGETVGHHREDVHFVSPKPEDVPDLMNAWMRMTVRLVGSSGLHPIVAAAVSSFAFVFIHPFEDGNGRIHRFLIHHILAKRGFGPPGVIFPVSAAILRDQRRYNEALETFSSPLFDFIEWRFTSDQEIVVLNDTANLYRYFDATPLVEYLSDRVADTIRIDLREELDFVQTYDRALAAIRDIVDMPDRRASLLVRLCLQNGGRLSNTKRGLFSELSDMEVGQMEAAVQRVMETGARRDG
ncbi:MAG: Fic family protein [Vicinamibacteraceae bacterium]